MDEKTLTASDRGKIDEIVEALRYLETEHLINYLESQTSRVYGYDSRRKRKNYSRF